MEKVNKENKDAKLTNILNKIKNLRIGTYIFLIIFSLLVIVPLFWVTMSSLKTPADFTNNPWAFPKELYFQNYYNAWVDAKMGNYFFNTVFITALSLFLLVMVSVPCAYVLSRFKFKFSATLMIIMMSGIFINVNYIVVPLYTMLSNFGAIFGVSFVDNMFVVALINSSTSIPFSVYLMSGFLVSLPRGYEEAAKIDGCGRFGIMFKIVVPLAMPSIVTVIIFSFLKFWNDFLVAQTFLISSTHWTLSIGVLDLMQVEKIAPSQGRMYAGLTIIMLPTLILYCFVQNKLTKGLSSGGLKG